MRVIVVGSAADRARLRLQLPAAIEIAAEFPNVSAARRSGVHADAIVMADAATPSRETEEDEGGIEGEALTGREVQVLELLAEGLPNKAIARQLGISDQTVKFHVASISGKLGAANRTDAVRRAVRRGLITL
jgi:DNA-binding NarL/FixJ family response regulator